MSSSLPTVLVRSPLTAQYAPASSRRGLSSNLRDGRPWLTWQDVEGMRRDPQVSMGLRILRAPIAQAVVRTVADSPKIAKFCDETVKRFWKTSLGHALTAFEYGNSAGEPIYRFRGKQQQFDRLGRVHLSDVRILEYGAGRKQGQFAGLRVQRLQGVATGSATPQSNDLAKPWCWWFALDAEPGSVVGRSRLHGALEPWREKRGRHGAIDSRRLYHHKCAFTGGVIRYPSGSTNMGTDADPRYVSNQDIAREILEKFENGGILTLPDTRDPESGNYLWEVEFAKYLGDAKGLLDYPKDLDKEILIGLGIMPELVEASTVGSGYSGRAIPAQVFFASLDEVVAALLAVLQEQILAPLVEVNFGRGHFFELEAESLAAMVAREPTEIKGTIRDSIDDPNAGINPMDAMRQAAGPPQRLSLDSLARRIGQLEGRRDKPSRVKVYPVALKATPAVTGKVAAKASPIDAETSARVRKLAAKKYPELEGYERDANGHWRLSWAAAKSKSGGLKAIGGGEHAGQFLYGEAARRVLAQNSAAAKATAKAIGGVSGKLSGRDFDAIAGRLPEEDRRDADTWEKVKKVAAAIAVRTANVLTTVATKAALLAPDILDTADDWLSIKMAKEYDPVLSATGLGANSVMVICSHLFSRALNKAGIRLSQETGGDIDAVGLTIEVIAAVLDGAGIKIDPPTREEIEAAMAKKAADRKQAGTEPTRLSAMRAPKGGATVQGKQYAGGEFIPSDVVAKATPEEKAKLDGDGDGKPDGKFGRDLDVAELADWEGERKEVAKDAAAKLAKGGFVMRVDDEAVGVLSISRGDGTLDVDHLATKRAGFGKQMMGELCRQAAAEGLGVTLIPTGSSAEFYKKLGMKWDEPMFVFTPQQAAEFAKAANAGKPDGRKKPTPRETPKKKPGDVFRDGMTEALAKLKAGDLVGDEIEDIVGELTQQYVDAMPDHAEEFGDFCVETMESMFGSAITDHPESEAAFSDLRSACNSAVEWVVVAANEVYEAAQVVGEAYRKDADEGDGEDEIEEAEGAFATALDMFQAARAAYSERLNDAAEELRRNLNNAVDVIAEPAVEAADELNSDTYEGPDDPDARTDAKRFNDELKAAGNPFRVYYEPESEEWTYAVPDDGDADGEPDTAK